MHIRISDNNCGEILKEIEKDTISDLSEIANKSLKYLLEKNPNLLIFPQSPGQYHDDIEKPHIFSLDEENITTYNLMGFVGRNSTQLTITSRFAKDDKNDYFLHYMLQKVFSINLLDFDQTPDKENIWDFLLYLFPIFLKKAFSQGLYKTYRKEEYNDANVKGAIDVKRHIKENIPFIGNIAYNTREHSYNNNLTQLIRHTIEYIKMHPFGSGILTNDSEIRDIVSQFIFATQKTYNLKSRQKIVFTNLKPFSHPYFTEYSFLQKICLQILRRDKLTYGLEKDKIYGLLFDGAWLWEEYLNTILKDSFIHPENKTRKNGFFLFENSDNQSFQAIFPDFISSRTLPVEKVCDAKYIPLGDENEKPTSYSENSERTTSIYYKTITYMYRLKSEKGYLLYPTNKNEYICNEYKIIGTNGELKKIGLAIPQLASDFNDFKNKMKTNEEGFKTKVMN